MAIGFVYLTTNHINGMRYIGQRHYHLSDKKSDDEYMGSGTKIWKDLQKYGKENFSKIVLEECNTQTELNEAEKKWIEKYNAVDDKSFYNIALGGGDSWYARSYYKRLKFKKRISESNRLRVRDGSKISGEKNPAFGRHWYKDMKKRKTYYLYSNDPLIKELDLKPGTFRSKKHNQKISNSLKGKPKTYKVGACNRKWMHPRGSVNRKEAIFVKKEDIQKYLDKDYIFGIKDIVL